MPSTIEAARLPLLERLAPGGHGDALDGDGLRAAIGRELLRLFNSRSSPLASAAASAASAAAAAAASAASASAVSAPAAPAALSVLDYGIPDWSTCYAASADDRQRLARSIEHAVRAFEPRLLAPRVQVLAHPAGLRQLQVLLTARLRPGFGAAEVHYAVDVDGSGAAWAAADLPA